MADGNVYEAYDLYLSAGLYNTAHDLAVLELAPDAINRHDMELLKSLFERFVGRPVDGWHDRGKACGIRSTRNLALIYLTHPTDTCRDYWTMLTSRFGYPSCEK